MRTFFTLIAFFYILFSGYAQESKNVLFILVDDLKPTIGAYGDDFAKTPNIDAIASHGVVFEKAYTQQAVCGPSRASMLTGLRPDVTQVRDLKTFIRKKNPKVVTLPQQFKNKGYQTHGIGKVFDPRSVDKGHDSRSWTIPYVPVYKLPGSSPRPVLGSYQAQKNIDKYHFYQAKAAAKGLEGKKREAYVRKNFKPSVESANVPDDAYFDGMIANAAIGKLDELSKGGKPFMLMVGFKKPHLPFVAPEKYWKMYDPKDIKLAEFERHSRGGPSMAYHHNEELKSYTDIPKAIDEATGKLSIDKQKELIHGYYASVSYIDAQIGKVIAKLKETGLDKNTIIVIWGDHGFHLGDHGLWAKHTNFEQATHLPLIISYPEADGKRVTIPVESVDIYPTVCELAGIKYSKKKLQGKSLVPIINGQVPEKPFAISQWHSRGYPNGEGYSIRTEKYRYTEWYKSYNSSMKRRDKDIVAVELYDYEADPLETRNQVKNKKYAQVVAEHKEMLHSFLEAQEVSDPMSSVSFLDEEIPGKPKGKPIKEIVAEKFPDGNVYIGATVSYRKLGTPVTKLLAEQFSYTVPENVVKQSAVHPKPGMWRWEKIDKVMAYAEKNNLTVRLHGPISPQASKWAKEDIRTAEELLPVMTDYMTEQCKHFYGNKNIKWMDVVNETVAKGGEWFGPLPGVDDWENPWLKIGLNDDGYPIYIVRAFEIATKEADPNIKLVYNQHLTMEPAVWDKVKETVLYLKGKGLRVDGIGWQAHLKENDNVGLDPDALKYLGELIDWTHQHGMEFHVTEIDYKIDGTYDLAAAQKQAYAYANVLKVLLSRRDNGVVTYNTWGVADGDDKHTDGFRFMFDNELRAKPIYYEIQKTLENPDNLEFVFPETNTEFDGGLIKNGSFENEKTGWSLWGNADIEYGISKGGNASIVIKGKSGAKQVVKKLSPNTDYLLTAWVKSENEDKVLLKIELNNSDKVFKKNIGYPEFTKVEIPFNTGEASTINVKLLKWAEGDNSTWVDNISIIKVKKE